ncbi:MAG TPA: hypothetical protein PLS94_13190 [Prolixibacteraceae bacterium]|nr:hypothetical protein [Prolixibacteraceae bacterium]
MLFLLCCLSLTGYSKSWGNFKHYKQITDKEVLLETSNGAQILITAIDSQALQISASANKSFQLIQPDQINKHKHLEGSIYVEELDEMMQITTTTPEGIVICINKKPFNLTYKSKANSNVLLNQSKISSNNRQSASFEYKTCKTEKLRLLSCKSTKNQWQNLERGTLYPPDSIKAFSLGNNIYLVSSKGYSILLEPNMAAQIDLSESEKLKISKLNIKQPLLQFVLVLGTQQPELLEKYAQILTSKNRLISLK